MSETRNQAIALVDAPLAPSTIELTQTRYSVPSQPSRPVPRPKKIRNSEIPWYCPTVSPEHGILLVLLGSFLTGAALAFEWSSDTTWACVAAFLGLQAEHPLVVQIKKRRQLQPRYALWAVVYGSAALGLATWLASKQTVLWWVMGVAIAALAIDVWSVFQRKQKAIATEILMFTAICLSTVFIYSATTGTLTGQVVGFWILNSLFFSSAVYIVFASLVRTLC